ncbi:Agenet domain protein [Quillaja saponaria]|uniref:Agenet domain protein n=1 Tax=Quillaja saponaria TaxID=32244 RepID=A0AAD7KRY7_QUISA|nr:Agenet domain protein [Quillaja saponaria]
MLLKSVGQEDFNPRQTIIEGSDACNELICLTKQMETNLKHDNKTVSNSGGVVEFQPPDEILEKHSALKDDVDRRGGQIEVSQARESEISMDGSSSNQDANAVCRKIDLPVFEGSLSTDSQHNVTSQMEAETPLDEKTVEDSHASGLHLNNMVSSSCGALSDQNLRDIFPAETNKHEQDSQAVSKEADVDAQDLDGNTVGRDANTQDKPLPVVLNVESMEAGNAVEAGVNNAEPSPTIISRGVSDLHKLEKSGEDICPKYPVGDTRSEDTVFLEDAMIVDQSEPKTGELSKVTLIDSSLEEHMVADDTNCRQCPSVEPKMSSIFKAHDKSSVSKEEALLNSGCLSVTETSVTKSEPYILSVEDNKIFKGDEGNINSSLGGISSLAVGCFSAKSCLLGESTGVCENDEVNRQDIQISDDSSVNDKDSTQSPDSSETDCNIGGSFLVDKHVASPTLGRMETELTVSKIMVDVTASASDATLENSNLTSLEIVDVHLPSRSGVTIHEEDQNDSQMKTSVVGSADLVKKEQTATRMSNEASEEGTAQALVCVTEQKQSCGSARELVCDTANHPLQINETCSTENCTNGRTTVAGDVSYECAKVIDVSPVLSEPTVKQGDDAEVVSFEKREKVTMEDNYEKASSKVSDVKLIEHNGETLTQPLALSLEESLSVTAHKSVEQKEAAIVAQDENYQQTAVSNTNSVTSKTYDKVTSNSSYSIGSTSSQTEKDMNEGKGSAHQNSPGSGVVGGHTANLCSSSQDAKGDEASKDDRSFTFDVNPSADLYKKDNAENKLSIPGATDGKTLPTVEESPSMSGLGQITPKIAEDNPHGSPQVCDREIERPVPKGTPERKRRRASVKASGKESSRKGSRVKEKTPSRQLQKVEKSSNVSPSPSAIFQLIQSTEMQQYGHVDGSSTKPYAILNASTSSLPDLNSSASIMFQQPFTDLQQVQLRAQIFVYGALIQGTVPDEAYMISAFGGPDGGRSIWEKAWRACMEKLHVQKSHPSNAETPPQSHTGPRASDVVVKQSASQGKGVSSSVGRTSSKTSTPTIVNPLIPLSSPLWSVPTPSCDSLQSSALPRGSVMDYQQALTPLNPYQSPPARNFLGHDTSWISRSPLHGPWFASPQNSTPENSAHLSASPVVDTVKLTSIKGPPLPPPSVIKSVNSGLPVSSGGFHGLFAGNFPAVDSKNMTVSIGQQSSDPKPRKRKKIPVSEDLGQSMLQYQSRVESASASAAASHLFTSIAFHPPAGSMSRPTVEKSLMSISPLSSIDHLKKVDRDVQKRDLSEEYLNKVKEARVNAEEAATLSAAAVSHSQEIWNQLDKQKNSGLVSDIEAKLASAAVAVAAAAAVARAAAAAANVASNAALQAKLMADEALASSGYDNSCQSNEISLSDDVNNMGKGTSKSILKGANGANSSSSIIIAAKEAVRRRVEAASAATKSAENMDAIVKAAELAAEAVSQAGKIVAMGEPLPLKDLIECGPEGFWKVSKVSSELVAVSNDLTRGQINIDNVGDGLSDEKEMQTATHEKSHLHKENYNETSENYINGISGSGMVSEKKSRVPKGRKVSDLSKTIAVVSESEIGPRSSSLVVENESEKLADNNIKEGSLVEVFKDGERIKAAWFTANVLSLKDGTAYVCYTDLQSDEGSGQMKEWVSLKGEEDKPPIVRIARPVTGLHYERTRKRRRAAMGDYTWSVGDRIDAWMQESWWEGVVTEKSKKDETTLTVHFPAHGKTLVVRVWHLRPSLIWRDGNWTEWSRSEENKISFHEGDTPHEKRPRLRSPAAEAKGKEKIPKNVDASKPVNPEDLSLLDLAENEKLFNIGKNTKTENKPDAQRTMRTGLQKEGSRVIFGIPKPGKKRKFMEVSKHYVADKSNRPIVADESVKVPNYLMPHSSGLRGWKNTSKFEAKEKGATESKPKTLKSGKPQSVSGRTIPRKDNPLVNAVNDVIHHTGKTKDSASHVKNASQSHNQMETGSYPDNKGTTEGSILYSSRAASSDASKNITSTKSERLNRGKLAPASGKLAKVEGDKVETGSFPDNKGTTEGSIIYSSRANSSDAPSSKNVSSKSERLNRGKLASASGKLAMVEEDKALNGNAAKSAYEVAEPRRSNRRIQPTSRLLEGLQSSLIVSKFPSVSHDKGHKSQNRNASRSENL